MLVVRMSLLISDSLVCSFYIPILLPKAKLWIFCEFEIHRSRYYQLQHENIIIGLGYCFSASLPPLLATAASEALKMIDDEPDRLRRLHENAKQLHEALTKALQVGYVAVHSSNLQCTTRDGIVFCNFLILFVATTVQQLFSEYEIRYCWCCGKSNEAFGIHWRSGR